MAWLGGALFVVSLAYFGWSYVVRFNRSIAPATEVSELAVPLLVNLVLFTGFALHHSVMARTGAKRRLTRHVPAMLERSSYVWVGSVLFILTCALWQEVPGVIYRAGQPWRALCWVAQAAGAWLTLRSAAVLDGFELAGIRQAQGRSIEPVFRLVGPYHWVRHPIYLGWVLLTFGTPDMTATKLSFAAISTAYLAIAVPFEERSLVEAFGDEYRRYQSRVRWRMLPGIY
jgi:protein-S-isoprenylcysteine O-methyltransferase Ste14